MNTADAKNISIDDLLQQLGFDVTKRTAKGCWYRSPFRDEATASFHTTPDGRGWKDFADGRGGNILDLAYRLTGRDLPPHLDGEQVKTALDYLQSVVGSISFDLPPIRQSLPPVKSYAYVMVKAQPFSVYGRGSYLSKNAQYLSSRGINAQAFAPYLEDVTYKGNDGRARYGFGMANVSGGYELRRSGDFAKTAVGPKDVTIFRARGDNAPWHCFYSLIDFGTFLTVDKPPVGAYNYLIVHSDSLIQHAAAALVETPASWMAHYPHADESGQKAHHRLLAHLVERNWQGGDRAHLYEGFKDWTAAREEQLGLSRNAARAVVNIPSIRSTPKL